MSTPSAAFLLRKYLEMKRLRGEQHSSTHPPVAALRQLAHDFPGALRELDQIGADELERRIDHLRAVASGPTAPEPWVSACSQFHHAMRGALWAKRWLRGQRTVDDTVRSAYAQACLLDDAPDGCAVWVGCLEQVASPPQGRLITLVVHHLARESLVAPEALYVLLFSYACAGEHRSKLAANSLAACTSQHALKGIQQRGSVRGR